MRTYRTIFGFAISMIMGMAFAASALAVQLDDFSTRVYVDDWPTVKCMVLSPIDFAVEAAAPDVVRRPGVDGPDLATIQFNSKNQPGQDWRFSADTYRHIDPGRRISA